MKRIYTPTRGVDDWQRLLAEPEKQWRTGFSARSLAYAWEEAGGFPASVHRVLNESFPGIAPLIIIPEHQVVLPGGGKASQNDVWVLAKSTENLVSIAVEGKVSEPFGPTVGEWNPDASRGRRKRFHFLKDLLGLNEIPANIRYQLLHRTASAVLEAQRFNAQHAVLLIHSFSPEKLWFDDFTYFVRLFRNAPQIDKMVRAEDSRSPSLHFAWVQGDGAYLKR